MTIKATEIPTYDIENVRVAYIPIKTVPGFTHRVTINNVAVDWLSHNSRPNGRNAIYYYEKHVLGMGKH